jgi:hypothetical protein
MNVLLAATHSNSFTTPDTKRTKGQGPGMVNVFLAAIHSHSFTTCGLRGQGPGLVNVLLAASPATRSRPRAIKGQEPGLVDVLLLPIEQRVFAPQSGGRERVAVGGGQKNVHQPWPLALYFFSGHRNFSVRET